jgi:spore coat polysaccharide biosynthesis predicted glycosyltransferase SpsG
LYSVAVTNIITEKDRVLCEVLAETAEAVVNLTLKWSTVDCKSPHLRHEYKKYYMISILFVCKSLVEDIVHKLLRGKTRLKYSYFTGCLEIIYAFKTYRK